MSHTEQVGMPTRDPFTGGRLVVTELMNPVTGTRITGEFDLGWLGALTPEQLDLVGLLLARRNNLQRLSDDLGIAYNTARSRLDEIARAVTSHAADPTGRGQTTRDVLERLAAGEITPDQADDLLPS